MIAKGDAPGQAATRGHLLGMLVDDVETQVAFYWVEVGRPAAVLVSVEGRDWEDVVLGSSAEFWRLMRSRRKERTIPMIEMKKCIAGRRRAARQAAARNIWRKPFSTGFFLVASPDSLIACLRREGGCGKFRACRASSQ